MSRKLTLEPAEYHHRCARCPGEAPADLRLCMDSGVKRPWGILALCEPCMLELHQLIADWLSFIEYRRPRLEATLKRRAGTDKEQAHDDEPPEEYVAAPAVALLIGRCERTVYRWAETGKIPCFQLGNARRYKLSEVRAALEKVSAAERDRSQEY